MKVINIFPTIQGEGRFVGSPSVFVRLAGCNLKCDWCDTKYSWSGGEEMSAEQVVDEVLRYNLDSIVVTGGEPLLQADELAEFVARIREETVGDSALLHLESNGSILDPVLNRFDHVVWSPKSEEVARSLPYDNNIRGDLFWDVKVTTDLETVNTELVDYASMLMPLTTGDERRNEEIRRRVWRYCIEHDVYYSPRLHIEVWGTERRGV